MNLLDMVNKMRNLDPGFAASIFGLSSKHDHNKDFGFPEVLSFKDFHRAYSRNSLAKGAVSKMVNKVWQEMPKLVTDPDSKGDNEIEDDICRHFSRLRVWQRLTEAEKRGLVGKYSGVILRIADNQKFSDPVQPTTGGGLDKLVEIIPAWEGQLEVSTWDTDELSETYGDPKMYMFNEAKVGNDRKNQRSFTVHPDRVVVWSRTGDVHDTSALEPGFNDLITIEKIIGAGGQGFWKNAKSSPVINVDKDARLADMAKTMGVTVDKIKEAMDQQIDDFNKGFDKSLMLQGMSADSLDVSLPSPEHFFMTSLMSFCASMDIPAKILIGSQSGERASTEDASEWAKTCKSYRETVTIPNIMALVRRLVEFNILRESDWSLMWSDLTEDGIDKKIDRADKMSKINERERKGGEISFTGDEIRETVGYEPLTDSEKLTTDYRDEPEFEPKKDEEEDEDA